MLSTFDIAALLFLMATLIGLVNERSFDLPRPIALLLGALAISLIIALLPPINGIDLLARTQQRLQAANLSKVLLEGLLALLLFAASFHVRLRQIRTSAWMILMLATFSVVLATVLFGGAIWAVFHLSGVLVPLAWCMVLGAILAPTDAVVVEQLFDRIALPERVRALITGEGLFNDGAAVVVFFAMLALANGRTDTIGDGRLASSILLDSASGALIGAAGGTLAMLAAKLARNDIQVITLSLALVIAVYRIAGVFAVSGPIAVVVAGLMLGNAAKKSEVRWRESLTAFWTMVNELLNTLLFLLIGFQVLTISFSAAGVLPVLAAIPIALLARYLSIVVPVWFLPIAAAERHSAIGLLTWTGMRGGISLALALTLPAETPHRDALASVCYAVVIFSVVVQGLLTPWIIAKLYGSGGSAKG
ncbi:MAG TPA: cation:proton antiporter [Xanthobacteraceae bacterium]|nr:cation:proton antiporter [Xanthobacteraceae bacterium]